MERPPCGTRPDSPTQNACATSDLLRRRCRCKTSKLFVSFARRKCSVGRRQGSTCCALQFTGAPPWTIGQECQNNTARESQCCSLSHFFLNSLLIVVCQIAALQTLDVFPWPVAHPARFGSPRFHNGPGGLSGTLGHQS